MNGYPYQRLADPRQTPSPTPQNVAQMLMQRGGGMPASPMAQAMGAGMPPMGGMQGPGPDDSMMHEGMESPGYEAAEGPEDDEGLGTGGDMGGMPMMPQTRMPARGMDGDYDPSTEHSPSATRVALENAVRQAMGKMQGSEQTQTPSAAREQLLRLGIPPLEVDLILQQGAPSSPMGM